MSRKRKRLMWVIEHFLFAAYDKAGALREVRKFFREHAGERWCPRYNPTLADIAPWTGYNGSSSQLEDWQD